MERESYRLIFLDDSPNLAATTSPASCFTAWTALPIQPPDFAYDKDTPWNSILKNGEAEPNIPNVGLGNKQLPREMIWARPKV